MGSRGDDSIRDEFRRTSRPEEPTFERSFKFGDFIRVQFVLNIAYNQLYLLGSLLWLADLKDRAGKPNTTRVENGTEYVSGKLIVFNFDLSPHFRFSLLDDPDILRWPHMLNATTASEDRANT